MAEQPAIAAIYLARRAEGLVPLRRFAASYQAFPAGIDHQLVVIYKGYLESAELAEARRQLGDLPHLALELDDSGFDVGSYIEAARRLPHDYMCPLNSFTEVAAAGWLALLAKRATASGVGIAGAMGSYESLYDSHHAIHKAVWLCDQAKIGYDARMHHYYRAWLERECPGWCAAPDAKPTRGWRRAWLDLRYRRHWRQVVAERQPLDLAQFPRFPNPHVRTTGFMIKRERLLAFDRSQINSKHAALSFESGPDGLTRQLRRAGLATVLVGKDDRDHDVPDWTRSGTFRLGAQDNLLVTDKPSRDFDALDAGSRVTNVRITWGDYAGTVPTDFPDLGVRFGRGALAAA